MGMLENKVGFVTGAGQGIGRAIAMSYAREGAKVAIADFNAEMGMETVKLIEQAGGEAAFIQGDVSKEESVKDALEFVVSTYGRLDIACNSAAVSRGSGPIHQIEREVFDQTLEMCLTNTWLCMKYEIAAMLETPSIKDSVVEEFPRLFKGRMLGMDSYAAEYFFEDV